jgi:23S rRNA pseudouridine1911/1915/1917 synthase
MNAPKPKRAELGAERMMYVDAHVVVVSKPAGVSTVPYEEGERGALDERVGAFLSKRDKSRLRPALGVVHRIDKETTGLVVFTRTWLAKQRLAAQFRAHTVHRRYLAIAHGDVRTRTFRSHLVEDRGDGLRGSSRHRGHGQLAVTHVERLEALDGATLIACRLETGRTHQIRIHLSEAGHPLVGERVYIRGYDGPRIEAPRLMLHAAELGFVHPATERPMRWEDPMPRDMRAVLDRLRRR